MSAFMPDSVSLLNQLTMGAASGGLDLEATFVPAQDDTTSPRIVFVPPVLTLFPDPFFGATAGNIVSLSFDAEFPYIVAFGAASAFGNFDVAVNDFLTYFDLVNITLPSGQIELGIGFIAAAQFVGFYDPIFFPVCPCGGLDIFAVDFSGNTANGFAPVVSVSF